MTGLAAETRATNTIPREEAANYHSSGVCQALDRDFQMFLPDVSFLDGMTNLEPWRSFNVAPAAYR